MLIIGAEQVRQVLDGRDRQVLDVVERTYRLHALRRTAVPQSVFLRFPGDTANRIIALPAYVAAERPAAGVKWVASFPGNVRAGRPRASAVIVLNSMATGEPVALVEGSTISARRTAAGAALAAATLAGPEPDTAVSLVGCGLINREVLRFLRLVLPELREVTLYDLDRRRAADLARRCVRWLPAARFRVADGIEEALAAHRLVAVATTAGTPHTGIGACRPGTLVLHLSLRDFTPEAVRASVNVVDDADHVCRAGTSLALAADQAGNRDFITAELPRLLATGGGGRDPGRTTLFSPFGLGALDIAVAELVLDAARARQLGTPVPGFLPAEPAAEPAVGPAAGVRDGR